LHTDIKCIYETIYMIHIYRVYLEKSALLLQDIFVLNYTDITKHTYILSYIVAEIMTRESLKNGSSFELIDYQIHGKKVKFVVSVILKSVLNI